MSFANIFSQLISCFFILFILYFEDQNISISIKYTYQYFFLYVKVNFKILKNIFSFLNISFLLFLLSSCVLLYIFLIAIVYCFFLFSVDLPGSEFPFYVSLCAGKFTASNHHQCKSKRYC